MELYRYYPGTEPVIINVPHSGTQVIPNLRTRFTPQAALLPDTDWHVDRLYNFARDMGVHLLIAQNSRYVVDLNRNKQAEELYPGQFNTEIVPLKTLKNQPVYYASETPVEREVQDRISAYWQPYHYKLQRVISSCIEKFGQAVLLDAHSINPILPLLFEGTLPALNLGSHNGKSAAPALIQQITNLCAQSGYSHVADGRFQGGYITRHYGNPAARCHALQMEITWDSYLDIDPLQPLYNPTKAQALEEAFLRPMVKNLIAWTQQK